jgi:subtilisin family serine protease
MTRARRRLLVALPLAFLLVASVAAADPPANDPLFDSQWGLQSSNDYDINGPEAWGISTGAGVAVAVVDTGVMAEHEDLVDRVIGGGWGFDGTTEDSFGHGTEVAGIIAATRNNRVGIAGVAPDASILPFRAFADENDVPDPNQIVEGLDRAGASGARVVNASFSTAPMPAGDPDTRATAHAIEKVLAAHPGTLFVTAAGNEGNDNDKTPVFPCSADAPNLLCVGAYTSANRRWRYSNYGAHTVDLFAPGTGILSTWTSGSGYGYDSGTSMAAPFVSGEAALLFSKVPRLSPEGAIGLILGTVRRVDAFASGSVSGGRPDAYSALVAATADRDLDGIYDVVDNCPSEPHATADGCAPPPAPAATPAPPPVATPVPPPRRAPVPRVRSLTARVTRCKAPHACRKSATVKLTPDRAANVSLVVERRVCTRGRCRWSRVLAKAFSASTRGKTVVVRGKRSKSLAKGAYRVVAVLSSGAGSSRPATRTFTVR